MNRLIKILLLVSLAALVVFGIYFLYLKNYDIGVKTLNVPRTKVSSSELINWQATASSIYSECKQYNLEFLRSSDGKLYLTKLLDSIRQDRKNIFQEGLTFSFHEIGDGTSYCMTAWIGKENGNGEGTVSYETNSGVLKTQKVKNYPVFEKSILD
jgi:hypothetical protein